jgi:hypothetical protein
MSSKTSKQQFVLCEAIYCLVLPSDMVDNSFSPCERLSGWFSLHSACLIGCFIPSLSICSQHH